MLEAGTVDVGFVCGLPYVLGRDKENPTVELLVTPIMKSARYKNVPKFYSYVSVIGYQLVL